MMANQNLSSREIFFQDQLKLIERQFEAICRDDFNLAKKLGNEFGTMLPTLRRTLLQARRGELGNEETDKILKITQQIRSIQKQGAETLTNKKTALACKLHKLKEGKAVVETFSSGRQRRRIFELSA